MLSQVTFAVILDKIHVVYGLFITDYSRRDALDNWLCTYEDFDSMSLCDWQSKTIYDVKQMLPFIILLSALQEKKKKKKCKM